MNILGLSCHYHDAAAALLQDGILVAAAEEERFSRVKHDSRFPLRAIDFCLRRGGLERRDLDYVVFYEKPLLKLERLLTNYLWTAPRSKAVLGRSMRVWLSEKLWIKRRLVEHFGLPEERILFTEHHMSHAASAFLGSPYREAAILTVDGVGEWATATLGRGKAYWEEDGPGVNRIELLSEMRYPHSLGLLYSAFTSFLGFEVNDGEYKVMGLAPYGKPRYSDEARRLLRLCDDGSFELDLDYFDFRHSSERTYSPKFIELFGEPRRPESDFFTAETSPQNSDEALARANERYADIAASVQELTEEIMLRMARHAHRRTGSKNLCLSGGVLMNSRANGRIVRETPFESVFIQPAAGDSGSAAGAALYAYHVVLNRPRRFVLEHAYWGEDYADEAVARFLKDRGIKSEAFKNDSALLERVADHLVKGRVIGWQQGRFEWGPRALGGRSILADPRRSDMKELVNTKIKFRETFRPFAPSIIEEKASEYFELAPSGAWPARFMLLVAPIHEGKQSAIPAVCHGGTGRVQTVVRAHNPRYHELIRLFGEATGVPVLLNTSFNLRGEPIVNSPAEAHSTFSRSGIDVLVLGSHVVTKAAS